jgi:hypothetical protein
LATAVEKWFWGPLFFGENLPKVPFLKPTPLIERHININFAVKVILPYLEYTTPLDPGHFFIVGLKDPGPGTAR